MSELLELAERVEKATGPDRELDLAITNAVTTKAGWFWYDDHHRTISRNDYGHGAVGNPICSLDPYTSFSHYAATLIPEGFAWTLSTIGTGPFRYWASVGFPDEEAASYTATAATPALALCAASIRAIDGAR